MEMAWAIWHDNPMAQIDDPDTSVLAPSPTPGPARRDTASRTGDGTAAHDLSSGTWVIDLDGVIWLTGRAIEGASEAVDRLRRAGITVLFATNNAEPTRSELLERLARIGIDTTEGSVVSSADAAASLVAPGSVALTLGGAGVDEALTGRRVQHRSASDPDVALEGIDAVIVGLTPRFDYDTMARAATAVRGGARLVGTNDDPTHPTPQGLLPGSGALVAAVATAAGATAVVAGKPYQAMVDLLQARAGDVRVVVGDRPATDGRLAARLGVPFALVRSGVLAPGMPADPVPDLDHDDLASLVEFVLR